MTAESSVCVCLPGTCNRVCVCVCAYICLSVCVIECVCGLSVCIHTFECVCVCVTHFLGKLRERSQNGSFTSD